MTIQQAAAEARLNTPEAADFIGCKAQTLNNWRIKGGGPPFLKIGRKVVYDIADLRAWLASRRRTSTSQLEAA